MEGDLVSTPKGKGVVLKSVGMRLRVQLDAASGGEIDWFEAKEVSAASADAKPAEPGGASPGKPPPPNQTSDSFAGQLSKRHLQHAKTRSDRRGPSGTIPSIGEELEPALTGFEPRQEEQSRVNAAFTFDGHRPGALDVASRLRGGGCSASKPEAVAEEALWTGLGSPSKPQAQAPDKLTSEVKAVFSMLSKLDEVSGLVEALEQGYLRLLRVAWLLKQPKGYLLENRQKLEERERAGDDPLLTLAEAAALIRKASRAIGVVSHGWLSPHHPDPAGKRLEVLIPALVQLPYIEALFFVRFAIIEPHSALDTIIEPNSALAEPHSALAPEPSR